MTHSDPIIEALIKRIETLEADLAAHKSNFYGHYNPMQTVTQVVPVQPNFYTFPNYNNSGTGIG